MKPRILLIGYGKFGKAHFEVLQKLDYKKQISLAGVVTKSKKIKNLPDNISTYNSITPKLLKSVDAVIIVTPVATHFSLVKKCLEYTHVFIEKPLALTSLQGKNLILKAKQGKKILAVGHIFRFNYAVHELKKLLSVEKETPYYVEGKFTGGIGEPAEDCGVVTSDMHLVDILDDIFGMMPTSVLCQGWTQTKDYKYEDQASMILLYPKNIHAYLKLGWIKTDKTRAITFYFFKKEIHIDLLKQIITIHTYGKKEKIISCYKKQPLLMELEGFIKEIKTGKGDYISGEVANRIVEIIEKARESMSKNKVIFIKKEATVKNTLSSSFNHKTIAVIGGGIFGVSIARELSSFAKVTLFEKNNDIFSEASMVNQNRHHYGYHYHQSAATAMQCKIAKKEFEDIWGGAILKDFPSFYCIAKTGSKLTPDEFRNFCKKYDLSYQEEWPSKELLNRNEISACFKTFEPVYDPSLFKALAKEELVTHKITTLTQHEVISGKIINNKKVMKIKHKDSTYSQEFDYVVNATYANINVFCKWFDFPSLKIDFRLKELLYIYIPELQPIGITIMDKFVSVLPVNNKGLFSLGDVVKSFHEKKISSNGIPWTKEDLTHMPSHQKDLLEGNFHFIPQLSKATLIEAKWTVLPVKTWLTNDDNRTTEIVEHGQGCWSVLGGKIITSVNTAKKIANLIKDTKE